MRRNLSLFNIVVMAALLLSACSPAATPAPATSAPQAEAPAESQAEAPAAASIEGCLGSAETALVDLNCRVITIAVENAYLPFNYIELDTGEPAGWDYDAWTDICTRLHCVPSWQEVGWDALIQSVADGQYDVGADGLTYTPVRAEQVDFSIGYIQIQQRLLVRLGEDRFSSIEEFVATDLILGTQSGTTNYETAITYLPEDRIRAYDTFPFAIQALLAGDLDAIMIDEVAGMGYLGDNADKIGFIGGPLTSEELGFIFPLGSDLIDPVNQAIQAMMADGSLAALNVKYFGPDFDITYDDIVTD